MCGPVGVRPEFMVLLANSYLANGLSLSPQETNTTFYFVGVYMGL